ncbi:piggyBac transposable element-derived protein 4-like [Anabrus simplex]|uniref:piggyBac transposable element-derived protein 4-like n=1 Tax=Anabrus simplex TaxID=316456 RepID=UPI0035A319BF
MDNFYNSPTLAQKLKSLKNDCVGTLCLNRKYVPKDVINTKLKKGEIIARHSDQISVLKWCDKKDVTLISTFHGAETVTKKIKHGQEKEKPVSVANYNDHMGGVDLKDQLLHGCLLERKKLTKWYIKLFRRLIKVAILNAMIICRRNSPETRIDHLKFRMDVVTILSCYNVVQALLVEHSGTFERKVPGRHSSDKNVPRLTERHFPERIPPTEGTSRPTKRCAVCYKQKIWREPKLCCFE